jgi:Type III flagellar switch regulator (C-ring) FliN C-term
VRCARFERRSSLPTSAACVVANGVRETLAALLGLGASLRLFEPTIPDPHGWAAIVRDALLYRIHGSVADAALILRPADAIALAGAAFGEPVQNGTRTAQLLSPIETEVVDRLINAMAANFSALCAMREAGAAQRVDAIAGFVTFFELLIESPIEARVGIALSREPGSTPSGTFALSHLSGVRVAAGASVDLGTLQSLELSRLHKGAILPFFAGALQRCSLTLYGRRLAHGTCGVRNGRYAFSIGSIAETA